MAEEYGIIGKITERTCTYKGCSESVFGREPITLYTITQDDGSAHRGGFIGHHAFPDLGDLVEIYLEKDNIIAQLKKEKSRKIREDGFVEVTNQETRWEGIKRYKIIGKKTPETTY